MNQSLFTPIDAHQCATCSRAIEPGERCVMVYQNPQNLFHHFACAPERVADIDDHARFMRELDDEMKDELGIGWPTR